MRALHNQIVNGCLGRLAVCFVIALAARSGFTESSEMRQSATSVEAATPRFVSLHDLLAPCIESRIAPCDVLIASPVKTTVKKGDRLPEKIHLHFSRQGSWTLQGETLDFAGAMVDASEDRVILPGAARVVGLTEARPEWFAAAVRDVYPAEALARAYRAVKPEGVILLQEHVYLSPFFDPASAGGCGGNTILIDSILTLAGARRPVPDSETAPTRLLNGSIIRGELCGTGVLHASHLGVDVGPFAVENNFMGHPTYGIQLGSTGTLGNAQGTAIDDVSVLTTGIENQHSVIIEGQRHASVHGLWVWTLGGTHGLVMKSSSSTIEDFHCKGAVADCLILKSDFATDRAGDASDDQVDGVYISSLARPGDTAGILLDGSWDSLRRITLKHIVEHGLSSGVSAFDSVFHQVSDVHVSDWSATKMTGPCLVLNGTVRVSVERFLCNRAGSVSGNSVPVPAMVLAGRGTVLQSGIITCTGDAAGCADPRQDGILDMGRGDLVRSVEGRNLGGYLLRTSPHRGGTEVRDLNAAAMGGRVSAQHTPPPFSLKEETARWVPVIRQAVRITLTRVSTTIQFLGPGGRWLLQLAAIAMIVVALALARTRRQAA